MFFHPKTSKFWFQFNLSPETQLAFGGCHNSSTVDLCHRTTDDVTTRVVYTEVCHTNTRPFEIVSQLGLASDI